MNYSHQGATPAAHIQFVQPITTTDDECRAILRRHQAGQLPGGIARRLIADELHRSGIADEVARERSTSTVQLSRDIASEMQTLLFQKMVQDTPGGFDLTIGLNASTSGWARQLLRTARPSIIRNIASRTIQKMELVDPIPNLLDNDKFLRATPYNFFHSASTTDDRSPADRVRTTEDAADWLVAKSRHLRGAKKMSADAASIMHALGLPPLIRPRLDERTRLKAMIDADPSMAHRSARYMHNLVEREKNTETIDSGLLALWDDFSHENLIAIATANPSIALSLVDFALSDRARPSRNDLRSFRASVRALGSSAGWTKIADELCESFIALEFEAFSAFDSTAAAHKDEKVAGRSIATRKSPLIFQRALHYPGQRLGSTMDELYEQLDRLVTALTAHEVKAPEAA